MGVPEALAATALAVAVAEGLRRRRRQGAGLGLCSCWPSQCGPSSSSQTEEREEFERIVGFLGAVPLFQKQLPRCELPKVARALVQTVWQPGERVIAQGEEGDAFVIIKSGEASVVVTDADGENTEVATLYYADYFGAGALTEKRVNVASIYAKGPKYLVTLAISRGDFERLGLHRMLQFPRRLAMYEGHCLGDVSAEPDSQARLRQRAPAEPGALDEEELALISKVIRENTLLRARAEPDLEAVRKMARRAERRRVPAGTDLVRGGELGQEFYVVGSGSFDIIPNLLSDSDHKSAEAAVASSTTTERLIRKQQFLIGLLRHSTASWTSSNASGEGVCMEALVTARATDFAGNGTAGRRTSRSRKGSGVRFAAISDLAAKAPDDARKRAFHRTRSDGGGISAFSPLSTRDLEAEENPFAPGDTVARVTVGLDLTQQVGQVAEVVHPGPDGAVLVDFPAPQGRCLVRTMCLRPVAEPKPIANVGRGACFGELALLYNARQVATCRAREDAVVYAIWGHDFRACFRREGSHFKDRCQLLDQVQLLVQLLRCERAELARNATGSFNFRPGERVQTQGEIRTEQLWYIIERGTCLVTVDAVGPDGRKCSTVLAELHRADHFGEFSILRNERTAEANVDAGPEGMTCLAIDGELLRRLNLDFSGQDGVLASDARGYHKTRPSAANARPAPEMSQLQPVALLGEGGFGAVFLVRGKEDKREYALKRMSKGFVVRADAVQQVCCEKEILSMLDSNFVMRFFRSYRDAQYVYILLEFISGGHLYQLLCESPEVLLQQESACKFYVASISYGLEHLHDRRIAYRDLKLENVLIDAKGCVKLCDLGFARFVLSKTYTLLGTPHYMAPEIIDAPHAHGVEVDWWALGVVTFELLTGQTPWDDLGLVTCDAMRQLATIRDSHESGLPDLLPKGNPALRDFVQRLLCTSVKRRLGSHGDGSEVRRHPWFARFDFDALLAEQLPPPYIPQAKVVEQRLGAEVQSVQDLAGVGTTGLFAPHNSEGQHWDETF